MEIEIIKEERRKDRYKKHYGDEREELKEKDKEDNQPFLILFIQIPLNDSLKPIRKFGIYSCHRRLQCGYTCFKRIHAGAGHLP